MRNVPPGASPKNPLTRLIKLAAGVIGAIVLFSLVANSCTTVDASHEGIKVSKIGSDRGASDIENVTGYVFYLPWASFVEQYPTFTQTKDYDAFSVSAKGGTSFTVDPKLNYHMQKGQGANVYRRYRKHLPDIETNILGTIVYNSYRDVANSFSPDSLVNNRAAFEAQVEAKLKNEFLKDGFVFENITSNLKPPASLQEMIDAKNTAVQNALKLQNDVAATKAEALIAVTQAEGEAKSALIKARAEAEANKLKQQSLTPLLVEQQRIQKWNGAYPTTMLGGGANTLFQLKQ